MKRLLEQVVLGAVLEEPVLLRYKAQERQWVAQLLVRLTPAQRRRYEETMRRTPSGHRSGKRFDKHRAQVAEAILLEDARK